MTTHDTLAPSVRPSVHLLRGGPHIIKQIWHYLLPDWTRRRGRVTITATLTFTSPNPDRADHCEPSQRRGMEFKFSPTWSCGSLSATHNFKWVKIIYYNMYNLNDTPPPPDANPVTMSLISPLNFPLWRENKQDKNGYRCHQHWKGQPGTSRAHVWPRVGAILVQGWASVHDIGPISHHRGAVLLPGRYTALQSQKAVSAYFTVE